MDGLLNKEFLKSIGVELDEATYTALSQHYEETLNERVITEIASELDEAQLIELQALKTVEPASLQEWLVKNVPQLTELIEDEIAILLGEIAENSDKL